MEPLEENRGYKAFLVGERGLHSAQQLTLWKERTLQAHVAPGEGDLYGIHSLRNEAEVFGLYFCQQSSILGIISHFGHTIIGEKGCRSEFATIDAIFTSDFLLGKRLQEWYPGVMILMEPPIIQDYRKSLAASWQERLDRAEKRKEIAKKRGVFRVNTGIKEFCKVYDASELLYPGEEIRPSKKFKPGDIVFRARSTTPMYFLASVKTRTDHYWMCIGLDGKLHSPTQIMHWDGGVPRWDCGEASSMKLREERLAAIAAMG